MKQIVTLLALGALSLPLTATAQDLAHSHQAVPAAERDGGWWFDLERKVNVRPDVTAETVTVEDLQEVIYFARHYGERLDLRASVPLLLDVYRTHPVKNYRLMAVAALDAIGDRYGMEGLRTAADEEPSEQVRRVTRAALKLYNDAQSLAGS